MDRFLGPWVQAKALRRFWITAAHYHDQVRNVAELAHSLDLNPKKRLIN